MKISILKTRPDFSLDLLTGIGGSYLPRTILGQVPSLAG